MAGQSRSGQSFQSLILKLQEFWAAQGCVILQPYDMEMGAGTFHPATTLRALGPKPWKAAYVQPSRRPERRPLWREPEPAAALLPVPGDPEAGAGRQSRSSIWKACAISASTLAHDIRFVEDDWESPTLGAWGLGWEVWCDGMEVTQFTYFQQVGGIECDPVAAELTYGLERLAMYIQGVENVYDLDFNDEGVTYGDVFLRSRAANSPPTISNMPTRRSCCGISRMPRPNARRSSPSICPCRPMTSASRPATASICSMRAA